MICTRSLKNQKVTKKLNTIDSGMHDQQVGLDLIMTMLYLTSETCLAGAAASHQDLNPYLMVWEVPSIEDHKHKKDPTLNNT